MPKFCQVVALDRATGALGHVSLHCCRVQVLRLVDWLQPGAGRALWIYRGPAQRPAQAGLLVRRGCSAKIGKPQALASLVSAAITKTVIGDGRCCTCGSDARREQAIFHSERLQLQTRVDLRIGRTSRRTLD